MAPEQEPLHYDDLTSMLRMEMSKGPLTAVRKDLYPAMTAFLRACSRECDRLAAVDTDSVIFEGVLQSKKQGAEVIKRLVEKRMKKISSIALLTGMGAKADLDNLTPEEREYHDSIARSTEKHLALIKNRKATIPDIETVATRVPKANVEVQTLKDMPAVDDGPEEVPESVPDAIADVVEEIDDVPQIEEMPPEPAPETPAGSTVVRILEDLPTFSGPDRDYTLKKEDIVRMPDMLAQALISREKAVKIIIA